jgi:hypothetical protein
MKILDAGIIMSDNLTTELKRLIQSEGHIRTGFMYRTIEVKFMTHQYENKTRIIFSIKAPFYYKYVEKKRISEGKDTLLKLLKKSTAYKDSMIIITNAIISEFGQEIIKSLSNKKEFKESLTKI